MSQPAPAVALPAETAPPPRWIAPWLALLAPLYVISPLALLALPQLKKLPLTARWVLAFYAISQQLPALFSPEPLLASVLALARTLLMFGLMGVGVALGTSERLKPFAIGLGIVFVTAIAYSVLGGTNFLSLRLNHPYMTTTTLALGAAIGLWLSLFSGGNHLTRTFGGISSLVIIIATGSRGAIFAVIASTLFSFLVKPSRRVFAIVLSGIILLCVVVLLGQRSDLAFATRLVNIDTTGRDIIWSDTVSVIRSAPWSGVGSYRLGARLSPPGDSCQLWSTADGRKDTCPKWISSLGSPWLIAHNAILQQLAETGPVGLAGYLFLLTFVISSAISSKNPFSIAIISGLVLISFADNSILLPSPFFSEIFWVSTGIALFTSQKIQNTNILLATLLIVLISTPLLSKFLPANADHSNKIKIIFFNAPTLIESRANYTVQVLVSMPPGNYRVTLSSCTLSCLTLTNQSISAYDDRGHFITMSQDIYDVAAQDMQLKIFSGASGLLEAPIAIKQWTVVKKK